MKAIYRAIIKTPESKSLSIAQAIQDLKAQAKVSLDVASTGSSELIPLEAEEEMRMILLKLCAMRAAQSHLELDRRERGDWSAIALMTEHAEDCREFLDLILNEIPGSDEEWSSTPDINISIAIGGHVVTAIIGSQRGWNKNLDSHLAPNYVTFSTLIS